MRAVVAVAAGLVLATAPAAQQTAPSAAASGRRFALLVGVTEFIAPAMKKHALEGPANDVALFRALLTGEPFNVPTDAIVSLAGLPADQNARPTRANIEREFRKLRDAAGPADHVLILLAGHGSQQPADPDPADDEPDGLDEIFLPADATGWDEGSSRVANAIVDDDIKQWVGAIRSKGAAVSILMDACHSGTMTRAVASSRRERGVPMEELIPARALARAVASRTRSSAQVTRAGSFDLASETGQIAAIYAADSVEGTPELTMPDRNGPVHGLFTYTVSRVLADQTGPITYRELVQRVLDRYRSEGFGPTPSFEGAGVDRLVLGEQATRDRAFRITGREAGDRFVLAGGSLHGLTTGSILQVGSAGHLRAIEVHPTTTVATPVAFGNMPAPRAEQVATGSRARVVFHEFGSMRLRVALARTAGSSGENTREVERALNSLETLSSSLAARVETGDADWFVEVTKGQVVLYSAKEPGRRLEVGAAAADDLPDQLADRLRRIARVANLSRLSTYVDSAAALQVEVRRFETRQGPGQPLLADSGVSFVRSGQFLQFTVKNVGKLPLDVTVLYVDANAGIFALYPGADWALDNRIDAGRERVLGLAEISANPVGWESVVAIGVEASARHENFRELEQKSLVEVRGASASALRSLFQSAVFGTRGQAAAAEQDRGRFAITQTWFRVEK